MGWARYCAAARLMNNLGLPNELMVIIWMREMRRPTNRIAALILAACAAFTPLPALSGSDASEPAKATSLWGQAVAGLSCSLRTDKIDYALGEDILLDVFLRNESNEIVTVIRPEVCTTYIAPLVPVDVAGPKGACRFSGPVHSRPLPMPKTNYVSLRHGEVVGASSLAGGSPRIVPSYWSMLEPGVYTIRFRFAQSRNWYWDADQKKEVPFAAWTGDLTSNPVEIRVTATKRQGR
jgi:hypothetical protein